MLIASDKKTADTIFLQQNAQIFIGRFKAGKGHSYSIKPNRGVWLQMTKGRLIVGGQTLNNSDAVAIEDETSLAIKAVENSEFLLFDLA